MNVFQRPCPPGWVYPCMLDDVCDRLCALPDADLEGLWAVGLVPATRKDCSVDARYYYWPRPTVHLYSLPACLSMKQPRHLKRADIERGLAVEMAYGMQVTQVGSRYVCTWDVADLRRFVVQHVLLHEIGHHVYHWRRQRANYPYRPGTKESEQFAEAYARRWSSLTPESRQTALAVA
jgi:hypothetical protein